MATKTQTTPSTFPRLRFGFGHKSSRTRLPPDPSENPDDPDWYIPYNGPYELPPSVPRSQNRDSWGQLLGSVLSNLSGATSSTDRTHERSGAHAAGGKTASHFPVSGAYSSHPYRTSAAQDAAGLPTTTSRARGGHPTPIITSSTAFAHIDTTGGVGESPTPMRRSPLQTSSQASTTNRLSLANLLNFGGSTRRSRSDSMHNSHRPSVKRSRDGPPMPDPLQSNRTTGIDVRPPPRSNSLAHVGPSTEYTPRQRSNTLAGTSMSPAPEQSSSLDLFAASQHRDSPLSPHPYAYAYSSSRSGPPRRAPMISPPLTHSHSLDKGKGVDRSYQYPQPPSTDTLNVAEVPPHLRPTSRTSLLKTISAPNLRNLSRGLPIPKPTPPRGKYRWLSPETWCDALLFPRPRFMEHIDGEPPQPLVQRNVSLPSPKAHTLTHTGGERIRTPLGRSWLRGSRSAVNLHVSNLNSSHGPPRAEPMLMAPKGSFEGDEWTSFSRPRSFAQDDLALPSPEPSIVKVLEMGASFERERATWRSQAERSLQSSKLTRSLGRSRSQSVGRTRAQLKDTGGVGFLATKTLLGNQLVAPTVGTLTSSEGTLTQQTRSGTSHARTLSSGHSRAGSKSKIAAIRAATGLCISDDKTRPQNDIIRFDGGGKGAGIEGQHNVPNSDTVSPAAVDSSAVGIALSSPPPSTEEVAVAVPVRPIYVVQDHPYAQGGYSSPRRSHARSSSDYAGPHPSAVAVTASASVLASDMSARHRLPPQAVLHPYASSSAQASAAPSQPAPAAQPAPPSVPYQTLPEAPVSLRPRHNPRSPLRNPLALPDTREAERVVPHAYAAGNRFSGGALGLADALSYGRQRRGSADSGLGESESHYDAPSSSAQLLSPFPDVTLAMTPEYLRSNFGHNSTFLSLHSRRTVASSPPATLNPPVFPASVSADSHRSAQASSVDEPAPGSRASSPLQSPRPFGTIEDLDRYRNLFYYPKAPGASRTPSDDHRRTFSRDTTASMAGLEISSTSSVPGNSGLAELTRQLGDEFGVVQDTTDDPSQMWWTRSGGQRGGRTDPNVAFSTMSDLYSNSDLNTNRSDSDAALLPLSLHQSAHHQSQGSLTVRIPQDVESHSSSVLGRSEMEGVDNELLRVGTVGVASTPLATTPALRLSFVGDVHRGRSQDSLTLGNYEANRASTSSTSTADATDNDDDNDDDDNGNDNEEEAEAEEDPTLPPLLVVPSMRGSVQGPQSVPHSAATTDATRSSYMTNDTGASRISGLSDFPVPPNQTIVSLDRVEVLKSYFAGDDAHAPSQMASQIDDPAGKAAAVAAAAMRLEQPSLAGPSQSSRERSADGEPELH